MHEKTTLRAWALQADVIAQQHCSHQYREKLLTALITQLQNYMHQNQPLWLETLIDLLQQANGNTPNILTHTETKCLLYIFRDTCFYLALNLGKHWLTYVEEIYDHRGNPERIAPFVSDPFNDWISNLDNQEAPEDKDDDDIPL